MTEKTSGHFGVLTYQLRTTVVLFQKEKDDPCPPPSDSIRGSYKEDYFHTDTVMLTYTTKASGLLFEDCDFLVCFRACTQRKRKVKGGYGFLVNRGC